LKLQPLLQDQIKGRIKANLEFLQTQFANHPNYRLLRTEGGWYVIFEVFDLASEEELILTLLERDNVLVHPGYFFDFPNEGFLILSLLPPPEIFREGIGRLLARTQDRLAV
jgi:aspartate/methionine/tyrosine aminotransferase